MESLPEGAGWESIIPIYPDTLSYSRKTADIAATVVGNIIFILVIPAPALELLNLYSEAR